MQAPFADPLSGLELQSKILPLVGRETELQVIRLLLDTVAYDLPTGARALTISGETGVGKTRLLAEMYAQARARGFRVMEGRTFESGSMFPYLPFIEALRPVLRSTPLSDLRRYMGLDTDEPVVPASNATEVISLVDTPMVAALARLFPELPRAIHVTIPQEVLSPDQEKFRLLDAIATLLERIGTERPVLLGIDNLQWADSASLELTLYLTVRLHHSRVALVGATRPHGTRNEPGEAGDQEIAMKAAMAATKILGDLVRQGMLILLPLGPLSADATNAYLHALLPGTLSPSLAQRLLDRAEGNPFFLEELVRALTLNRQLVLRDGVWKTTQVVGTTLPASIISAVEQRLQGLNTPCRDLLRVAALFGRTFPLDALTLALEESEEKVQALIDEVTQAAIIAKSPAVGTIWDECAEDEVDNDGLKYISTSHLAPLTYMFCQGIVQLAILLNQEQKAEEALWQSYQLATQIGDRGSQAFALHLVGWLRGWGEQIHEAIRLQEQAHELYVAIGDPFRAALGDQGLGIVYQALGEMERARLHTLRGFECARRYGVRRILGWLHWNQGVMALNTGDWPNGEAHLQRALQETATHNDARLKPMVIQAQAELQFRRGNWREAEQLFQDGIQAATNTEWFPGSIALYGHFLAVTGRRTAARAQLDRAAEHPEPPGFGGDFYIPFLAEGYLHLGVNERATTYIERIRCLHGFMYYGNAVDRILGVVATQSGNWEMAEQAFEEGLALCRRAHNQPEEAAIYYEQARMASMRSGTETGHTTRSLQHIYDLCRQARKLFLQYDMQRAVDLVNTLQEGVQELEQRDKPIIPPQASAQHITLEQLAHPGYQLELTLTKREREVLRLVAEGHTDREVADALVISPRTVNRHLSNIFVKLDVPGRAAAVAFAVRQGLV